MSARRRGFTLIELLVVIAIIAILAAMLFPVFARARESARKIQCLANVKNIATAFQMYLVDYERFPPSEHRAEVNDYFGCECCNLRPAAANPYLQTPVILDEYVKNREVWRCPSARLTHYFPILNPYLNSKGTDDWFLRFVESQDGCPRFRSCNNPFPPGWGGAITDTQTNRVWCTAEDSPGAFEMSVGVARHLDVSTSQINDPAKRIVCADAGQQWVIQFWHISAIAYPDVCRIDRIACNEGCGSCAEIADSDCCMTVKNADCAPARGDYRAATDPTYRKTRWPPRHLGGSNVGFADGHASWIESERLLFGGQNGSGYGTGEFEYLVTCTYPVKTY